MLNRICRTVPWLFFMLSVTLISLSHVHMTNQWPENCLLFPPCVCVYKPRNHRCLQRETRNNKHEGFEDDRRGLRPLFGTVHHHKRQTNGPNTCLLQGRLVSLRPNLPSMCREMGHCSWKTDAQRLCFWFFLSFCGQAGWSSMSSS